MNSTSKKFLFVAGLLGCCAALLLSGCSKKSSDAVIGKWRVSKDNTVVEFRADGTMHMTDQGQAMSGTYKFSDNTHMKAEMTMTIPEAAKANLPAGTPSSITVTADCVVTIKGDEMDIQATMTMPGQKPQVDSSHLTRIKE